MTFLPNQHRIQIIGRVVKEAQVSDTSPSRILYAEVKFPSISLPPNVDEYWPVDNK